MKQACPSEEPGDRTAAKSVAAILRNQHPEGSFIASPDFSQYRYCWLRDGAFTSYALDRAGEVEAADRFHRWCGRAISGVAEIMSAAVARQARVARWRRGPCPRPASAWPARPSRDDWPNFQIDGYGTWLWSLDQHLRMAGGQELPAALVPAVEPRPGTWTLSACRVASTCGRRRGARCTLRRWPASTPGLVAGSRLLDDAGWASRAEPVRGLVLEQGRRTATTASRITAGRSTASLLWLGEPFHLTGPGDPAFVETVRRIHEELDLEGGIRRYPSDVYYGSGAWPVLTASLGWHHATAGDVEARRAAAGLDFRPSR